MNHYIYIYRYIYPLTSDNIHALVANGVIITNNMF
jgi:hypothetical protein